MFERKIIDGYPNYAVGNDGSAWTRKKKIGNRWTLTAAWNPMTATIHHDGYRYITLYRSKKARSRKISVLVAELFIGEKPKTSGRQECRHKNGIRHDDRVENLEWGTTTENAKDRDIHNRTARGERNGFVKLTDAQVAEIISLKGKISQGKLAKQFGVSQVHIGRIHNGKNRVLAGVDNAGFMGKV